MFHIAPKNPKYSTNDFIPFGHDLVPHGGHILPQVGVMPMLPAFGFKPNTQVSSSELEKKNISCC